MRKIEKLIIFITLIILVVIFMDHQELAKEVVISISIPPQQTIKPIESKPIEPVIKTLKQPIIKEKDNETRIRRSLVFLEVPKDRHRELVRCIKVATSCTGIKEELVIALMSTESEFNKNAISPKNYKGLMQTPKATFKYPEVDTLYGAKILEDKLKTSNGNMMMALTLYKGGNNELARKYARQTYKLYQKLLTIN